MCDYLAATTIGGGGGTSTSTAVGGIIINLGSFEWPPVATTTAVGAGSNVTQFFGRGTRGRDVDANFWVMRASLWAGVLGILLL